MVETSEQNSLPIDEAGNIEGVVERIVYENRENGFFVARLQEEGKRGLTTFVGNLMAVSAGETIRLWGKWVEDKRFGRQLRVEKYETVLPATAKGIEKYLGSGLVQGIGPKFAKRLVDAFGRETLRVIDEEPERLRKVNGIGKKRAGQIREAWSKQKSIQSIMLFLQGHDISTSQAIKIYKRYGEASVAVLRENPYRLAEDITGIAFRTADEIAEKLGIDKSSPQRAEAGLVYVLQCSTGSGHVYVPVANLLREALELLDVGEELLQTGLETLYSRNQVIKENGGVFLRALYEAETGCDRLLKRLISAPGEELSIKTERAIEWVEKAKAIELSGEQRQAIRVAVDNKVMVITGGPGTGKTTLLNCLNAIFFKKDMRVLLAAPTGRAAKRMEEATDREAKTIHRLLEYGPHNQRFAKDEFDPLACDIVVIDESSMIDIKLMHSLLKAIPPNAKLFLVGDVDQLPSVGPGNVLMDIISSGVVPVVWLKTVFRQAAESGIISNAHRINSGQVPQYNAEDFFFVERKDPAKALETVVELVLNRIPKKFGFDPINEIQVLSPMHKGDAGVTRLNEALQEALNANGEVVANKNFRIGDKIMQMRNNYELEVFNGDVGIVTLVDDVLEEVQVQFDDRLVLYGFDDLDDLKLAYAATIHKSQGSEYKAVVLPLLKQHYMLLQRNVLYTAITRGKELVVLVGDPAAVGMAVRNANVVKRNTMLAERLRNEV